MSDFTAIETREQLDAVIGERIKRERESMGKKYEGYISPDDFKAKAAEYDITIGDLNTQLKVANEKIAGHDKEIAERDKKIKAYESHSVKTRIAHEIGLSYEAIDFLKGDDEESIRKSAEILKGLVGSQPAPPLADMEKSPADTDAALRKTLRGLKGE